MIRQVFRFLFPNTTVEDAVLALGGTPTLNLSADQELADWPKLSDTTKPGNLYMTLSRSSVSCQIQQGLILK